MPNPHPALITCSTNNIGDDIQSLAVSGMMPEVAICIDRERISDFVLPAKAVIAGWYKHDATDWPPHPNIKTMFVGFHAFHSSCVTDHIDYLKTVGSIGCRDQSTQELCSRNGLDAYFSGCVTLTLPQLDVEPSGLPLFIDVPAPEGINHMRCSTFLAESNPQRRLELAQERLRVIASASCVVTTRLHAALPAAAMGIPVLLIPPPNDPRFKGLLQFVHHLRKHDDLLVAGFVKEPQPNPNAELRQSVAQQIRGRVADFYGRHEESGLSSEVGGGRDQVQVNGSGVSEAEDAAISGVEKEKGGAGGANSRASVGLVTLWTPEISDWCLRHAKDKEKYCKIHELAYYAYDRKIDEMRAPTWSKILALQEHLGSHDWLFWIDADTSITNPDFDVRSLCLDGYDLVITHDHSGFNAGIFLIRNTAKSHDFLERVWNNEITTFHFEQTSMSQVMMTMPDLKVKVLPKRSMNSYWFDHRPGDFIFHAAGEPGEMKTKLLTVFANTASAGLEGH